MNTFIMDNTILSNEYEKAFIQYLKSFLTSERIDRIESVLSHRTDKITVMLENIYQSHNASAVLRSCDCFGIQNIYTAETIDRLMFSKAVTKNVEKWLTLHRFYDNERNNTINCIEAIKSSGYLLVATSPHETSMQLHDLPVDKPLALMFGREKTGLSKEAIESADFKIKIPMFGFSESLNISVSAAIAIQTLTLKLKRDFPKEFWKLSENEEMQLRRIWYRKAVRNSKFLENDFLLNWNK